MSATLLVTGAAGFVGRHLTARAAAAGWDVRIVDGDLSREGTAERVLGACAPTAIIHLATPSARAFPDPWEALVVEMTMLARLTVAVGDRAPGAVLLAVGSAAQYGAGLKRPLTERDATEPLSSYGARKSVLERAFLTMPIASGVRRIWCRSFNHAGPGQGPETPLGSWSRQLVAAERAGGGSVHTGRLSVVRDLLDVRDVADAYLALVAAPDAEGVVNVCSGRAVSLEHVVELLLDEARCSVTRVHDHTLDRGVDPPQVVGDPRRLRDLTGWEPSFSLAQTIHDTVTAIRADLPVTAAV